VAEEKTGNLTMKKIAIMLLTCCALGSAIAAEQPWLTSLPQAVAQAKKEDKMVLLDFTGSDWCGWCMKFKKETLDTPEFTQYAATNLVLVEFDFPHKIRQSEELKRLNQNAATYYKVTGYPTFILLNKDGKEIGRQDGYEGGGAKAFIARLGKFKASH
jgi:thioredoxin-related protein